MKKTNKNQSMGMSLGLCIGVAIGTSLGSVFHNIAIGISIGMCAGMGIGSLLGARKDNVINRQIEEKGYAVQSIEEAENGEYVITIANKVGVEQVVTVPKGVMDEEAFSVGDIVFLDDDGLIEQAFDKDEEWE